MHLEPYSSKNKMYIFAFLVILQENVQLQYTFQACWLLLNKNACEYKINLGFFVVVFCFKAQDDLLSSISIRLLIIQIISV